MASKTDANTAAGSPGTGAERLAGKGDFIRVIGGNVRRFQVPMVDGSLTIMRKIQARWADVNVAPVHAGKPLSLVYENVAPPVAPVHAPPLHQLFPLSEKRPLSDGQAIEVQRLAETMSKNQLCIHVYGSKSTRYMEWLNEAMQRKCPEGKIIKFPKVRQA